MFGVFWESFAARKAKEIKKQAFCCILGAVFYAIFCPLLRALLRALRRRENRKKVIIHWFLWVARRMRLFRAQAEAINF